MPLTTPEGREQALAAAAVSVATTRTTDGTLVAGIHQPVDATSGNRSLALPTSAPAGSVLSVEKTDAGTNTVTLTGSVRGVGSSSLTLVGQYECLVLRADSAGSWWPYAGHKTKTYLDATYGPTATQT